jgi:hypothetical protein
MDNWDYLGTDDRGIKAYINQNPNAKFRYMEVDQNGKVSYHN